MKNEIIFCVFNDVPQNGEGLGSNDFSREKFSHQNCRSIITYIILYFYLSKIMQVPAITRELFLKEDFKAQEQQSHFVKNAAEFELWH